MSRPVPIPRTDKRYFSNYDDAIRAAQQKFLSTGGHGLGLTFMDSSFKPRAGYANELRLTNVQAWIVENTEPTGQKKEPTLQELANKPWNSVMPNPVFELDEPLVFRRDGYLWRNTWYDTGVDARCHRDSTEAEVAEACGPFLSLVSRCLDGDQERVTYYIDWLRVALQPRDRKPPTALYTYGAQGSFKGTILNCLSEAFGHTNIVTVDNDKALVGMEYATLFKSRLVVVEEVRPSTHDGSAIYTNIKGIVASDAGTAEYKHDSNAFTNTPGMLWLQSNHPPPFLEDGDRRFWVVNWQIEGLTDNTDPEVSAEKARIRNEIMAWLHDGGAEALRAYLTYFPPTQILGDAPPTPERESAICGSMSLDSRALAAWLDHESRAQYLVFTEASLNLTGNFRGDRGKHIAREAGLVEVPLTSLSKADYPRITVSGAPEKLQGKKTVVWVRDGWAIKTGTPARLHSQNGEDAQLLSTSTVYGMDSIKDQPFNNITY